jgi:hypothetical protein
MEWDGAKSARGMIEEIYQSYNDNDGNFLEQFQTTGFDARYFEIYLYAYFSRSGFSINQKYSVPDFLVSRNGIKVAIEATTVNPSTSGVLKNHGKNISDLSDDELQSYMNDELVIRFGGPLFSKLNKKYWELDHCKNIPVVLAIQAFHDQESLTMSDFSLTQYLYGLRQSAEWNEKGDLSINDKKVESHSLGDKEIPSYFFNQPDTENISAVLFTNSGTNAKFARMGFQQGIGCDVLHISRSGFCYNADQTAMDATFFQYNLDEPPFVENWGQGLIVLHNPNCLHPIPKDFFVDAVQGYIEDGKFKINIPFWHPYSSKTIILYMGEAKKKIEEISPKRLQVFVAAISKQEFQAACGFIVSSNPIGKEHGWYADYTGSFLGVVVNDIIDNDWVYVVLARDSYSQFRAIHTECGLGSRDEARIKLQLKIAELFSKPQRIFPQ